MHSMHSCSALAAACTATPTGQRLAGHPARDRHPAGQQGLGLPRLPATPAASRPAHTPPHLQSPQPAACAAVPRCLELLQQLRLQLRLVLRHQRLQRGREVCVYVGGWVGVGRKVRRSFKGRGCAGWLRLQLCSYLVGARSSSGRRRRRNSSSRFLLEGSLRPCCQPSPAHTPHPTAQKSASPAQPSPQHSSPPAPGPACARRRSRSCWRSCPGCGTSRGEREAARQGGQGAGQAKGGALPEEPSGRLGEAGTGGAAGVRT